LGEATVGVEPRTPASRTKSNVKRRLAHVAGTQEPIYGPSAIKSVAEEAKTHPYSELTRDDLKWQARDSTCVETQSFYLMSDSGYLALAQVIYSNVA
jgi:hypothetical protein